MGETSTSTFQFTHPRRVRLSALTGGILTGHGFNSRTRVGCDAEPPPPGEPPSGFNSRTRVGCDQALADVLGVPKEFQFTHPRRVRRFVATGGEVCWEFQFTHPRRVRPLSGHPWCGESRSFNSRTRVGCDTHRQSGYIHTIGFNSRTRVGCDTMRLTHAPTTTWFQFTHPRRVRPLSLSQIAHYCGFNSRTRVGCDP